MAISTKSLCNINAYKWDGWMISVYVLILIAIVSNGQAQTLQTNFPVTNGAINAMVQSGNNIFLGGAFTYAGPNTGRGVGIDATTGNYITGFPDVNGPVYAVVSDGGGGWYIGGKFTYVGGVARNSLAHIKSDKTVDTWNPNINDGAGGSMTVCSITKYGSLIYVGGMFTNVGSTLRSNVAAIDSATGIANSWNPAPDNFVFSIVVTPQYTFLGGKFVNFGNANDTTATVNNGSGLPANRRPGIAELITGKTILTQWVQSLAGGTTTTLDQYGQNTTVGSVYTILLYNGSLYVGGNFTVSAGGVNICSLDTVNAYQNNNHLSTFHPNTFISRGAVVRPIFAMAISGDTIFVGGQFGTFGNVSTSLRYHIAAASISNNTVFSWNPNIPYSGTTATGDLNYVSSITVANGTVYASGKFSTVNGTIYARNNIAAFSQSVTATATSWNPNASDAVTSIALQGNTLYAGGNFTSVNGQNRNNLCEINTASGTVTPWNPNPNTTVQALALSGSTLFVGGLFSNVGGQARSYLAGIDTASGLATAWQANANGQVSSLFVNAGKLYVGGYFSMIGGIGTGDSARSYVAQIDTSVTAKVSSWNASADQGVTSMAASGSTIYVSGGFSNIGGQARAGIAALSGTTGVATAWNPNPNPIANSVKSMAISGSTMYVGGTFTNIGGAARNCIAAISMADTGTAKAWNPNITGTTPQVTAIALNGSTIYAGGYFTSVGATTRTNIAAIDTLTGSATAWACSTDSYVYSLLLDRVNHFVYMGGSFTNVLNRTASYFTAVTNPGDAALPVELTTFTATAKGFSAELHWMTATEVNNYGFEIERSEKLKVKNEKWNTISFVEGSGTSNAPKEYSYADKNIYAGKFEYRLKQIDRDGKFSYSQSVEVEVGGGVPKEFTFAQNYPNPFNPTTILSFTLPNDGRVALKIYNVIGQEVATLFNQDAVAGKVYQFPFDATKLSAGIYFSRLEFGGKQLVRKLLLVK